MDIAPIGCIEGHFGGGFAVFGSSSTETKLYELPPKHEGEKIYEPFVGLLTHAIVQCLLGHVWCKIDGTQRLYIGCIAEYVSRFMDQQKLVTAETRGMKGFGDFPVLEGDRVFAHMNYMDKIFFATISGGPAFGVGAMPTASAAGGAVGLRRSNAHVRAMFNVRPVVFQCSIRFDVAEASTRVDVFDNEFPHVFTQLVTLLSQSDPSVPQHKQAKISMVAPQPSRQLIIGINATFMDIVARSKTKGGEAALWSEIVSALTNQSSTSIQYTAALAKEHEGGGVVLCISVNRVELFDRIVKNLSVIEQLLGASHNAIFVECSAEFWAPIGAVETLQLRARGVLSTPSHVGPLLNLDANATLPDSNLAAPSQPEGDKREETPVSLSPVNQVPSFPTTSAKKFDSPHNLGSIAIQLNQLRDHIGSQMLFQWTPLKSSLAANIEDFFAQAVANLSLRNSGNTRRLSTRPHSFRLTFAAPIAFRLNDMDDGCVAMMSRRERPYAQLSNHAGVAVCCVAMLHPAPEIRTRQLYELQMVASTHELTSGIRLLLWDVHESTKHDSNKAMVHKLLESIKMSLGTGQSSYPALLLFDFHRKRFYRLRIQLAQSVLLDRTRSLSPSPTPGPAATETEQRSFLTQTENEALNVTVTSSQGLNPHPPYYSAASIAHFCEEFIKGALNDLLPPVKGSKVIGGGTSTTKYTLIAL
jgi:hypothetical protein